MLNVVLLLRSMPKRPVIGGPGVRVPANSSSTIPVREITSPNGSEFGLRACAPCWKVTRGVVFRFRTANARLSEVQAA